MPSLSRADLRFCEMVGQWKDIYPELEEARYITWSARKICRVHMLASSLLDEIRSRRSDLDLQPLAELTLLNFDALPPNGELVLLVRDATDAIFETYWSVVDYPCGYRSKLGGAQITANGRETHAPPDQERLACDPDTWTIIFGGVRHEVRNSRAFKVFECVAKARGATVRSDEIRSYAGLKPNQRIDKVIADHLPAVLRALIPGQRGQSSGYALKFPSGKTRGAKGRKGVQ
jgi:hypothetical protein